MAEDVKVRQNRVALLMAVDNLFSRFAYFGDLVCSNRRVNNGKENLLF